MKSIKDVKKELKEKVKGKHLPCQIKTLTESEKNLIQSIDFKTKLRNENNVTRTKAYLEYYLKYPEIHWAFLGHMVSRNGGWNMTDLKGELFTRLLTRDEQEAFYSFLERGNWLIFQDIYPQFLLYEEYIKTNKNFFYLLPFLHVSTFMETMWNYFLENHNPYPLAIALIINEQSYLEKRVIQNNKFKKAVLNTLGFKVYDFFRFNHILFPLYSKDFQKKTLIIGETSTHFTSLHERIMLGKRLYSVLFLKKGILPRAVQWAKEHPHTGSRKDYWPHLFSDIKESHPRKLYEPHIQHCELIKGRERLYSPPLQYAWENINHAKAEEGDWFKDWHVIKYITNKSVETDGEIYTEYCATLETIELAILAKSAVIRE